MLKLAYDATVQAEILETNTRRLTLGRNASISVSITTLMQIQTMGSCLTRLWASQKHDHGVQKNQQRDSLVGGVAETDCGWTTDVGPLCL
jgi:hypothetical protein